MLAADPQGDRNPSRSRRFGASGGFRRLGRVNVPSGRWVVLGAFCEVGGVGGHFCTVR
jgi:hypothetical protein